MFKPRSTATSDHASPTSIEVIRVRARQRLIGAAVLVGIGVIGFPLVFDTEPRPLPVDVPIEIPARQLSTPARPVAPAAAATAPASATPAVVAPASNAPVATQESLDGREEVISPQSAPAGSAPPAVAAAPVPKPEPEPKPVAKPEPKPAAKPEPKPEAAASAKSIDQLPTTNARIVVQVGAFADPVKAREARLKLERAGLPTYTHVAKTPDGERIRVRMGPFKTKAEADKAAARAKSLGLEAGLFWL
jgi:DedD protein